MNTICLQCVVFKAPVRTDGAEVRPGIFKHLTPRSADREASRGPAGSLSRKENNNVVVPKNAKGQVTGNNKMHFQNPHSRFCSAKLLWERILTLLLMASVTFQLSPFSLCRKADTNH